MRVLCGAAFAAAALVVPGHAAAVTTAAGQQMNPIRKVVNLLQAMQKKVQEEGEKEKELFERFMCYCKHGQGDLSQAISAAEDKAPAVSSDIEASQGKLEQAKGALSDAQSDRVAAKEAMAQAKGVREKEAGEFKAFDTEYKTNIAAINKAVDSLNNGVSGGFLQTGDASTLRQLVGKVDLVDMDRQDLMAFLDQGTSYAPQSGSIIGILEQLGERMSKDLAGATDEENSKVKMFGELIGAKKKEVAALTSQVETKTTQIGELGVHLVSMKEDLSDTQETLLKDKQFLADLDGSCETKGKEWDERQKTRADELVALAEAMRVLNDDDALDLFKKTLPSPNSRSFVQLGSASRRVARETALTAVRKAETKANLAQQPGLEMLALALGGKKALSQGGFDKVIKMIDNMNGVLKTEQQDDDAKKEYCAGQFDQADDSKKDLSRTLGQLEVSIANAEEGSQTLKSENAALHAGIKDLDKSVADATQQRRDENAEYKELLASNSAAVKLLGHAKNTLNKFYNKALYKEAPKRELSRMDRIGVNNGLEAPPTPAPGGIAGTGVTVFAQVAAHSHRAANAELEAPAPPPSTWGAYQKKSGESNGVMAMVDLLVKDLEKELTEGAADEKNGQADYEKLMGTAAEKRAADSKAITEKDSALADLQADLEDKKEGKTSTGKELMATEKYIQSLHAECDWLVKYYDVRKEARAAEVDSLNNAKSVLSGSDYALLQAPASKGFLARKQ